jgi:hypothetical protein
MLDWCRACACINNHIKAPRASTQVGRGLRKIAATLAKAGVLAEGSEPLAHRVARAEQMAAARRDAAYNVHALLQSEEVLIISVSPPPTHLFTQHRKTRRKSIVFFLKQKIPIDLRRENRAGKNFLAYVFFCLEQWVTRRLHLEANGQYIRWPRPHANLAGFHFFPGTVALEYKTNDCPLLQHPLGGWFI